MTIGAKGEEWIRSQWGMSRPTTRVVMRFRRQAPAMLNEDDAGEALKDVAGIHRAVDRLRDLITSATALDLRASAEGYWASGKEGERATTSP